MTAPNRAAWLDDTLRYLLAGRTPRSIAQGCLVIIVPLYLALLGLHRKRREF